MKDVAQDLLLALNIESIKKGFTYNLQSELVYSALHGRMLPRQKILKYHGRNLVEKIRVKGNIESIEYLSKELKLYEK